MGLSSSGFPLTEIFEIPLCCMRKDQDLIPELGHPLLQRAHRYTDPRHGIPVLLNTVKSVVRATHPLNIIPRGAVNPMIQLPNFA